jgi:hypothetical protein
LAPVSVLSPDPLRDVDVRPVLTVRGELMDIAIIANIKHGG